jgi:hypothetical protein
MPKGRSTFTKRQKEQTRQQRQRDKAANREQRKLEKPEASSMHDLEELRRNAEAQAAMFQIGFDPSASDDPSAKKSFE